MRRHAALRRQRGAIASILAVNGFVPGQCYTNATAGKLAGVATWRSYTKSQITVGLIEVHDKRDKLLSLKKNERQEFLEAHPVPAVWGPDGKLYITDHHHLGRACSEAGVDTGFFLVEDDFSKVAIAQFWPKMAAAQWVHPIDQVGKPRPFEDIPNHLEKLVDDPYRSLAGYVRNAGGFTKTPTAFAEFLWADFFRPRVPIGPTRHDFEQSVAAALKLASSNEAAHLPGYNGPHKT